jgi:hypothetical protein
MNQQDPFGAFSPNTIRSNRHPVSQYDLFGVDPPQQIIPESLITPPTDWPLWNGTTEGGVFGITSTLDSSKEFHFNIKNEAGHYKITPAPGGSSGEAREMLLRVSRSDYNGPLHYPHPTLVLNGPGIDFGSQLRIRIVNRDNDSYDIYYDHDSSESSMGGDDPYSSESSMNGGVAKSVRRHSRKLYSRRRVYKKRVSMKRRCRRSRCLSRRSRSRKN